MLPTQTNPFAQKPDSGKVSQPSQPVPYDPPPPFMAKGEDKFGRPYYGEGVQGYVKKIFANIFDPAKYDAQPSDQKNQLIEKGAQVGGEMLNKATGWDEWIGKWTGISAQDVAKGATAMRLTGVQLDEQGNPVKQSAGDKAKSFIQAGAGTFYRASTQAVKVGMDALQWGDKLSRVYQSTALAQDKGADTSASILPELTRFDDSTKFGAIANTILRLTPVVVGYNALRFWTNGKSIADNIKTIKDYSKGSGMIYTMSYDEQKREEYIRRLKSGESPDQITAELENTWVELAGSILGDPNTYLGTGIIGDFGKAETPIKFLWTDKVMFKVPWRTVTRIPGLSEIFHLGLGAERVSQAGDIFTKVSPEIADAIKIGEKSVTEASAINNLKNIVSSVSRAITGGIDPATGKAIKGIANDYGFFAPDSNAKADIMKKTIGTVMRSISSTWKTGDDMGEFMVAATNITSKDPELAAKAFAELQKYGNTALSEAGLRTIHYVSNLNKEMDIAALIEKYGDDTVGLTKAVESKLFKAVEDSFPSVNDMIKAKKALAAKEVMSAGELQKANELASKLDKLPEYVKISNQAHNLVAENKIYKGFQSFFAGVYMGLSPAFAMRNIQNNAFTMWHDMGTGAALEGIQAGVKAALPNVLGGQKNLDAILEREMGKIAELTGGAIPYTFGRGVNPGETKAFGALAMSGRAEEAMGAVALRMRIETEMNKMLRYGFMPTVEGVPTEAANRLKQLTLESFGDVEKALVKFRQETQAGSFESWRHLALDSNFEDWLRKSNKLDEFNNIRRTAQSPSEFAAKMKEFSRHYEELGKRVANEAAQVGQDNPMGPAVVYIEKAIADAGVIPQEEVNQFKALTELREQLLLAHKEYATTMYDNLAHALPTEVMQGYSKERIANEIKFDKLIGKNRDIGENFYQGAYQASRKNTKTPAELWNTVEFTVLDETGKSQIVSLSQSFPDVDPAQLSQRAFQSMAWKWVKEVQGDFWSKYTQTSILEKDALLERMAKEAGTTVEKAAAEIFKGDNPKLTRIGDLAQQVKDWENYVAPQALDIFKDLPKNTKLSQLDLSLVPEFEGGKTRLFNAVNKDRAALGKAPYSTFDEVPASEALKSLKGRLSKAGDLGLGGGNALNRVKEKAAALKAANAAGNSAQAVSKDTAQIADYLANVGDEATQIQREFAKASRAARGTGETPKLQYNKLTQAIQSMPNEALSYKYENFVKKAESLGVTVPPELKQFFESMGGEATRREVLDFAARLEMGLPLNLPTAPAQQVQEGWTAYNAATKQYSFTTSEAGDIIPPPIPPYVEGTQPTLARQIYENYKGGGKDAIDQFVETTMSKWGETVPMSKLDAMAEEGVSKFAAEMQKRVVDMRTKALAIADENRNFMFHDYNKTYGDKFFGTFLQYHYWPSRTYMRWAERLIDQPGTMAAWAKYKDAMDKIHADMPEYYRYNVPIGKLPGMDNSPMYFNLEQTINPLYGLTGVDYNDPYKRADWASATLDDMGKMGFSTFTPVQWIMGLHLYAKGENEAAQRWMGRLIPATQSLKAGINLFENKTGVDITPKIGPIAGAKYGEFDPFINVFAGGMDPSEEKRVGRAMATLIKQGVPREQAFDALLKRDGPLYDQAVNLAINERAGGQVASYFLGLGYKNRTEGDLMVEKFYDKYYKLLAMRNNVSPEDYRTQMDKLKEEFPFADTVLLAKRGGAERDGAYAYNVLSRVSPGMSDDLLTSVGVDRKLIDKFYNDKGDFSQWSEQDKSRFMAGILDLGAMLKMPDYATKQDWNDARDANSAIYKQVEAEIGSGIWDLVDTYYQIKDSNVQLGFQFKEAHPEITQALARRQELLMASPETFAYFGSLDSVENYFSGKVRAQLKDEFGDLAPLWAEYYNMKLTDPRAAKQLWNAHPELKAYSQKKAELEKQSNSAYVQVASQLPERDYVTLRSDFQAISSEQERLAQQLQQPQNAPSLQEIQQVAGNDLSPAMMTLLQAYYAEGTDLKPAAQSQLDYLASRYGSQLGVNSGDEFLRMFGVALYKESQPPDPNQWANPVGNPFQQ